MCEICVRWGQLKTKGVHTYTPTSKVVMVTED